MLEAFRNPDRRAKIISWAKWGGLALGLGLVIWGVISLLPVSRWYSHMQAANQAYNTRKFDEAERHLQAALTEAEASNYADALVGATLNNLATIYMEQNKTAEVDAIFQRAIASLEKAYGPRHESLRQVLQNYAVFLENQGRYEEAEAMRVRVEKMSR